MIRELLGALFGVSVIQSPDPLQQSEKIETIVHEEVIESTEGQDRKLELASLEKGQKHAERPFIERTDSVQICQKCPLHCLQGKEKKFCKNKLFQKAWISQKMQCFKVEMSKITNKIFQTFESVKSNAKEFVDKKKGYIISNDSRNRLRSR